MGNGSDGRSRASRRFDQAENSLRQRQARVSRVTSSSPKSSPVRDAERYPFCTFLLTLFKKPLENTIQAILFPRVKKKTIKKKNTLWEVILEWEFKRQYLYMFPVHVLKSSFLILSTHIFQVSRRYSNLLDLPGVRWILSITAKVKTLPKALWTQALTALTSSFGLVGLVQYFW